MADKPELPSVGTEISMPVVSSPTRTTIFAENGVVGSVGQGQVEVIFLRNELVMPVQRAIVSKVDNDEITLAGNSSAMAVQLTDIGHVRMTVDAAVNMAMNILGHARVQHGEDLDVRWQELTARVAGAK